MDILKHPQNILLALGKIRFLLRIGTYDAVADGRSVQGTK